MISCHQLTRRADWAERLNTRIARCRHEPFRWGHNDCCLFAAAAISAMTGTPIMRECVGAYASRREAASLLRRLTGVPQYQFSIRALPGALGFLPVAPKLAGRGDLVLIDRYDGHAPALGIVSLDARYAVSPGAKGLVMTSRAKFLAAWKVG